MDMIQTDRIPGHEGFTPRGERRIVYNSDPSSIARHVLPDPVEAGDLQRWVDMLADSGVDTLVQDAFNQGFPLYWRSDRFQYDLRPQHQRFLPLLDAGTQPLQVLLDRSHERGMAFLAGIRMNDGHDFPVFADFIESHPQWQLPKRWELLGIERPPEAAINVGGKPLDYTFDEVRAFHCDVMEDLLDSIDVDGLELIFRESYFPLPKAQERAHLMTDMMRRVRHLLDERSDADRRLMLGVRVYSTLEECLDLGLDVPGWIDEGLIDYCCPMDTMFSDFNAHYAEFGPLTRNSDCMMYPGLHPWTSHRMRLKSAMTPAMCRALAHTFYACGADGISIFNHFVGHLWLPPFYPQALQVFHDLRDPQRVAGNERHYVFDPTNGGLPWMGLDRNQSGTVNAQRVVLDRTAGRPSGVFQFRLYEDMDKVSGATLLLRGAAMTAADEIEVCLNGAALAPGPLGRADARARDQCPDTRWFPLPTKAPSYGDNQLSITLTEADAQAGGDLIIDEVEVFVQPR